MAEPTANYGIYSLARYVFDLLARTEEIKLGGCLV